MEHQDYYRVLRDFVDERVARGLPEWDETVPVASPPASHRTMARELHVLTDRGPSGMESDGSSERVPVLPRLTPEQQERRRLWRTQWLQTRRAGAAERRRVQAEILALNEALERSGSSDPDQLNTAMLNETVPTGESVFHGGINLTVVS